MKKLLLFIIFVVLLVGAKFAYTKYCEFRGLECKEEPYEENYLTEDHMDS